jgi:hypothetical protein
VPTYGATSLLYRTPGHTLPDTIIGCRSGHPKRSSIQKYTTLAPLALSKTSIRPPSPCYQKSVKAKTSLAALREQTDYPLDQLALAKGVFIFDLFGLCCGLCVALGSQLRYPFKSAACRTQCLAFFSSKQSECDKIGAYPRRIFKSFLPRSIGPPWVPSDNIEGALASVSHHLTVSKAASSRQRQELQCYGCWKRLLRK